MPAVKSVGQTIPYNEETKSQRTLLMNLESGHPKYLPYIFSSKEDDIAIIYLDDRGKDFIETLIKRGYIPITIEDVDTRCDFKPKQSILSFGFSSNFAESKDELNLHIAELYWKSDILSMPVVAQGTIARPQKSKNQFTANISLQKGSSGGAIVSKNKLIGIIIRNIIKYLRVFFFK